MSDHTTRLERVVADAVREPSGTGTRGLGVDVVSLSRFGRLWDNRGESLRRLVFTSGELEYARSRADTERRLAGTFAAKEAVFKALGLSWARGAFAWTMIEILRDERGLPHVALRDLAWSGFVRSGAGDVLVSISYEDDIAIAVAQAVARAVPSTADAASRADAAEQPA